MEDGSIRQLFADPTSSNQLAASTEPLLVTAVVTRPPLQIS